MGALPQNYKTIGLQGNKTTYNMFCAALQLQQRLRRQRRLRLLLGSAKCSDSWPYVDIRYVECGTIETRRCQVAISFCFIIYCCACVCVRVCEWERGGAVDPICCAVYVYREPAKFYDHRSRAYQFDLVITNANGARNRSEDKAKQGKGLALNYSQLQRSKL